MRILILGGTGFIGPCQVRYAQTRGHQVTVFHRGGNSGSSQLPAGVEELIGDREGRLDALEGRTWDVCIDNPAMLPSWVRDAARILRGIVGQYVFVSTIAAYADHSRAGQDESAALATYSGADAMQETLATLAASEFELYGPLKAIAEQEAERAYPGRTLIIRPGLIVGPGDKTDRFTYWPVRMARGGKVAAPGSPADPVQFIDVRDLAEWIIRLVETGETGTYNATGPAALLTMGAMLAGINAALPQEAELVWLEQEFLAQHQVAPWSDLPVWLPPHGEMAGFSRRSIGRALDKGLTFRPLAETVRATLAWWHAQPADRTATLKAGLTSRREAELLAAWAARTR